MSINKFRISLLLFLSMGQSLLAISLDAIRIDFKKAAQDETAARQLLTSIQNSGNKDALFIAYQAATEALMAKHAFLPTSKYSWCKRAMNTFNIAVGASPENMEIRYLRIAVEVNLPAMLGMSGDIAADKNKILQLLPSSKEKTLNKDVIQFLLDRHLCTAAEEITLRQLKTN